MIVISVRIILCITESYNEPQLGWLNHNWQFYHNLGRSIMMLSILEISLKTLEFDKPKRWPTAWSTCKPGLMPTQDLSPNKYGFITKGKSRYTFPIGHYCAFLCIYDLSPGVRHYIFVWSIHLCALSCVCIIFVWFTFLCFDSRSCDYLKILSGLC